MIVNMAIPETEQTIIRPIIIDMVKQISEITKIDNNIKILFPGDIGKMHQSGSTIDSDSREPLLSTGLATEVQLDSLEKQLNAIRQPESQKMGWLGRQLIQAVSVPVGATFGSVIGGMAPAMFGGK